MALVEYEYLNVAIIPTPNVPWFWAELEHFKKELIGFAVPVPN